MNYTCHPVWGYRFTAPVRSGLRVVTAATGEQITLAEAKNHLKLDDYGSPASHPDDTLIEGLITAAREWAENYTGRAIVPQTFELVMSRFPTKQCTGIGDEIPLPMAPIVAVSSVTYLDGAGASQTVATSDYTVDNWSTPGYVYPINGVSWPNTEVNPGAVTVRYSAGFTLPTDSPNNLPCPKSVKSAMLLIIGHLYANREQTSDLDLKEIPLGVTSLLDTVRIRLGVA